MPRLSERTTHNRTLVKAAIQHYSSGSSHWIDVWQNITLPLDSGIISNRRMTKKKVRSELSWLIRKDPEVIGVVTQSGAKYLNPQINYARSG